MEHIRGYKTGLVFVAVTDAVSNEMSWIKKWILLGLIYKQLGDK